VVRVIRRRYLLELLRTNSSVCLELRIEQSSQMPSEDAHCT
jgi:hypothetical protein